MIMIKRCDLALIFDGCVQSLECSSIMVNWFSFDRTVLVRQETTIREDIGEVQMIMKKGEG